MKPSEALKLHRAAVRTVVESHRASNPRVFGSVLHGLDHEASDLDILIDPNAETSLMDVAAIQVELQQLLGVRVDIQTPRSLPDSFRSHILLEAETI
ncbi:MAG: nucleotidyltransferase domain-containing protein [Alphaproteobacteria bacterium]|nr:nucleotidyltransferase domain-containing protein [Alphaproteobacteria bacterium]